MSYPTDVGRPPSRLGHFGTGVKSWCRLTTAEKYATTMPGQRLPPRPRGNLSKAPWSVITTGPIHASAGEPSVSGRPAATSSPRRIDRQRQSASNVAATSAMWSTNGCQRPSLSRSSLPNASAAVRGLAQIMSLPHCEEGERCAGRQVAGGSDRRTRNGPWRGTGCQVVRLTWHATSWQ